MSAFVCEVCGKGFSRANALGAHRSYVHLGKRPKPRGSAVEDDAPVPDSEPITVAFSQREWTVLVRLARREHCTPTAVVRAAVQRVLREVA